MATYLRCFLPTLYSANVLHGLPWFCTQQYPYLHLEPEESRYDAELPRSAGFQGAISTLGSDAVWHLPTWFCAEGRDLRHDRRS